jgi:hypothetical protein
MSLTSTEVTAERDSGGVEFDVVISFEQDDPNPLAALGYALEATASLPGRLGAWVEESHPSEDQTVPGDQHHEIRARFTVRSGNAETAAEHLLASFAKVYCREQVTGIAVDGRWLQLDELA